MDIKIIWLSLDEFCKNARVMAISILPVLQLKNRVNNRGVKLSFYAPTSDKLRGRIGLDLSVLPSSCQMLFGSWETQESLMLRFELLYVTCT